LSTWPALGHLGLGEKNLMTFKDLGVLGSEVGQMGSCCYWSIGLLSTWGIGHLASWALGHLVSWTLGPLGTGLKGFGQCSVTDGKLLILVNWALRYLENWALGLLGTWSLVSWTLGLEDLRT
jgi:hypothetical protein